MFDPFQLQTKSAAALELLVDELVNVEKDQGVPLFSNQFRRLMEREIPKAKIHALKEYDWNTIPDGSRYCNRSHRQKLRKEQARVRNEYSNGADNEFQPYEQSDSARDMRESELTDNWKDDIDIGEYSSRI